MHEIRKDPILGRWVIIASERSERPSDYLPPREEPVGGVCPFCSGSEEHTPPELLAIAEPGRRPDAPGWRVRVVPNKFPALRIEGELGERREGIFERMQAIGAHEVIIESPEHRTRLADMSPQQVADVAKAYVQRVAALGRDRRLRYVLLFKNQGAEAGATLEHAHTQIIATPVVPKRVVEEMEGARRHFDAHGRCIFCDMVEQETSAASRIVRDDESFLALVPFAARFPYETWILPRRHALRFEDLDAAGVRSFAAVLRDTLRRLDAVLGTPAFNFVIHTAPSGTDVSTEAYHWHLEIMPKLAKVAGFEWGSGFYINPTPPEYAAEQLRAVPTP
jgi:UDPglucose--hexose-1-phosphate uridylyltransferase